MQVLGMFYLFIVFYGILGILELLIWRFLVCEELVMFVGIGLGFVCLWGLCLVFLCLDLYIYCIVGRDFQVCLFCKDFLGSVWVLYIVFIFLMFFVGIGGYLGLFFVVFFWLGFGLVLLCGRLCGLVFKELGFCIGIECLVIFMMQGWFLILWIVLGINFVFGVCLCVFFKK